MESTFGGQNYDVAYVRTFTSHDRLGYLFRSGIPTSRFIIPRFRGLAWRCKDWLQVFAALPLLHKNVVYDLMAVSLDRNRECTR